MSGASPLGDASEIPRTPAGGERRGKVRRPPPWLFRARFEAATIIGTLDWPPVAQIGRLVRVYDPADRARFLAGEQIKTDYGWNRESR